MSLSPLGGNNPIGSTQFVSLSNVNSPVQGADSDNDGSQIAKVPGKGGKLVSAIDQTLSQLGVSSSAATSSTSDTSSDLSTQDSQQALASFMQQLFAAMQPQAAQGASSMNDSKSATAGVNGVTAAKGHGHHHHGGGMGKLEGGLQSLLQQLSASDASTSGSSASGSGSSSSNSAIDALKQSFNNLLTADGASGSNVSLNSFLQTLSQNLQSAPPTGNVVSTQA